VIEELEYEPYGQSRRTAQGDFNRDGTISVQDNFDFLAARFAGDPSADENDDGTVSVQDIFDFLAEYLNPDSTPRDRLSSLFFDNPYGYCGYYGDAETAAQVLGPVKRAGGSLTGAVIDGSGCLCHVRHRVYDPSAGRWLTRDPAGFIDGMNLCEYCGAPPLDANDPFGLLRSSPDPRDDLRKSPRGSAGSPDTPTPTTTCTSRPPAPVGSTRSSASSPT
jgi:RHS repeat-associated protein